MFFKPFILKELFTLYTHDPASRNTNCVVHVKVVTIGKESPGQCRRCEFDPLVAKIPWRRKWQPTPVFLPGKFHGQRSLVGYSTWGPKRVRHDWVTKQQQLWKDVEELIPCCLHHNRLQIVGLKNTNCGPMKSGFRSCLSYSQCGLGRWLLCTSVTSTVQ